jgi:hypothetical protein
MTDPIAALSAFLFVGMSGLPDESGAMVANQAANEKRQTQVLLTLP